jgi:hypothetical protein
MKLAQVLDQTNSLEKNSFYKILNNLIDKNPKEEIESLLSSESKLVKDFDNVLIATIFNLLKS